MEYGEQVVGCRCCHEKSLQVADQKVVDFGEPPCIAPQRSVRRRSSRAPLSSSDPLTDTVTMGCVHSRVNSEG